MTPILKLTAALVAGASFFAWQPVQAQCSTAAWTGAPVGNAAAGAAPTVRRYSGACGLSAVMPGTGYVVESTNHANEGVTAPFRARFFVYPAITSGNVVVFQAMDADSAGNPLVQVRYDATAQRFDFINSAGAVRSTSGTAPASRWYRVTVEYQANLGTGLNGSVRGNGGQTFALAGGAQPTTNVGVQAVRVGAISGSATGGSVFVDEYEASRAAMATESPFTAVIRGDANGNGTCASNDITATANELLFNLIGAGGDRQLAAGQPDCDENGTVNSADLTCTAQRLIDQLFGTPCN
jgi:hypothetical protein